MKTLQQHITEKLKVNKDYKSNIIQVESIIQLCNIISDRVMADDFNGNLDLSDIDVSKLTSLNELFFSDMKVNTRVITLDVTGWDVSNVETMYSTFRKLIYLKEIKGIADWDVSSLKRCGGLFEECKELEELDLSKWNTKNLIDAGSVFKFCKKLKTPGDLSKWNTDKLSYIRFMFCGCESLETVGNIDNWYLSAFCMIDGMFTKVNRKFKKPRWYR